MQAPLRPSTVSTRQVVQAPKPQPMRRSMDTWQGTPALAAWAATPAIMGWGPQA